MKFYIVQNPSGEVVDCYLLKRQATACCEGEGWTIHEVECPVNKWTVRRILAGEGYANKQALYDHKGRPI